MDRRIKKGSYIQNKFLSKTFNDAVDKQLEYHNTSYLLHTYIIQTHIIIPNAVQIGTIHNFINATFTLIIFCITNMWDVKIGMGF